MCGMSGKRTVYHEASNLGFRSLHLANFGNMNGKMLYCLTIILLCFPQISSADPRPSVICVQEQLNALGFETGTPDGVIGRKTHSALAQYEKANGKLTLRKLAADNAVIHCRQLGLRHQDLKVHWPSQKQQFEFVFGESISPKFRTDVSNTITGNFYYLQREFNLDIPLTIKIVVASSDSETLQLIREHYKLNLWDFSKPMPGKCGLRNGFSGVAVPQMIVICRDGALEVDREIHRWWFEDSLAHEMFHQIQYQLAGWTRQKFGYKAILESDGPVWMSEGSAAAFSIRASNHWTQDSYRAYSWERLEETAPNLAVLEREDSFSRYKRQIYNGGRLAVFQLTDTNGFASIISFYENLGKSVSWEAAFQQTFGITKKEFYSQILKMDHG